VRRRIMGKAGARDLLGRAAAIHYVDRSHAELAWLPRPIVEQKKTDALACVRHALGLGGAASPRPERVVTSALRRLAEECGIDLEAREKEGHTHPLREGRRT
jgi:hypothetical protein